MEHGTLGKALISLKYVTEVGGWFTKAFRGSYGVGLWKEISKEISHRNSTVCSLLEMVSGSDFGRMRGVAWTRCVRSSLLFTLWQTLREPGFRKFGEVQGRWGVGILVS